MPASLNVVLFGETGVGKSSVINLIAEQTVAEVSSGTKSCTLKFKPYTFPIGGRDVHIWDTRGLDEPHISIGGYLPAIEQACDLIHELSDRGGVDLLLFCFHGRVKATTQSNYRLFYEVLCRSQVPIAIVITNLERESNMEDWWRREAEDFETFGIKVADHACVTGIPGHDKSQESRRNIVRLLEGHDGDGKFTMPPDKWFKEFLRLFGAFSPLTKESKRKDIMKVLTKRCGLDKRIAEKVADKLLESGA